MKTIAKWILPLLLVAALIGSAVWYMFVYDRETVEDFLVAQARSCAQEGNFRAATWFYGLSYQLSDQSQNVAIELADIYKSVGNYTKAESTLTSAIADGASPELYIALCKTFVEQDKLLDAVTMLDKITDPGLKAQLDALRPAAPQVDLEPGFYNQYITLNFTHSGKTLLATTDGEYPSLEKPMAEPSVSLDQGETKIYALSIGENGLVSPLSIFNYTVGGVIEQVTLADPVLEFAIRELLLFGTDTDIYTSDLWTITEFTVPAEAESLEDLALLTHLEKLTIADRKLDSLSFLAGMTLLQELRITGCRVEDTMSFIASLPSLEKLTLSGCSLSSVAELAPARMLLELDLSNNAIGNLEALANMTALEKLDLSENAVSDLSVLAGLPQLKELDLAHNAVSSIVPLTSCAGLTRLDISYNNVTEISALTNLSGLTHFAAGHNSVSDLSPLASCTLLEYLDVSHNAVTDIAPVSGMGKLRELNFSYNAVAVLPALAKDVPLTVINGEHNLLTDVSPLGTCAALNYVYLDYNAELKDISFLINCSQLVQVNVYATAVPTDSVNALIDRSVIVNFDPT